MLEVKPSDIQSIHEPAVSRVTGEGESAFKSDVEAYKETLAVGRLEEDLESARQDRCERKTYAGKIYKLLLWWVVGVFVLLLLNGFGLQKLSDGVLIAVVSGTTASVIGIFLVVANYLFPKR